MKGEGRKEGRKDNNQTRIGIAKVDKFLFLSSIIKDN